MDGPSCPDIGDEGSSSAASTRMVIVSPFVVFARGCARAVSTGGEPSRTGSRASVAPNCALFRRSGSLRHSLLSRSCAAFRPVPARRLGVSRARTEESPQRADPPTRGACSRPLSAPRLSPAPPRPASVSRWLAQSRPSPPGPARIHWSAPSTGAGGCVSARAVGQSDRQRLKSHSGTFSDIPEARPGRDRRRGNLRENR